MNYTNVLKAFYVEWQALKTLVDADKKAVYVIKASGSVDIARRGWLSFVGNRSAIAPGDTIVVPLETDEALTGLPLVTEASQIIYQLSLGAAALNQLRN